MAEVIEVEIEQASEQEQRGREDEVVSVLSRLRPPVASDLSRKRKLVTNPGKGNRRSIIDIKPKMGQINIRKK